MERGDQGRRKPSETEHELNSGMAVFNNSHVLFSTVNQHELQELLVAAKQEVAFSYSQELSVALDSSTASGVPPVHELFCGFIGSYRYVVTSPTRKRETLLPVAEPQLLSEEHDCSIGAGEIPVQENWRNLKRNKNAVNTVKSDDDTLDWSEIEYILDYWS